LPRIDALDPEMTGPDSPEQPAIIIRPPFSHPRRMLPP